MVSPAFPGLFFSAAAAILLLFASISPPAWDRVDFLHASVGSSETVFGVFGECVKGGSCSTKSVGYDLVLNGATGVTINETVLHNLTYTMILHPIGGFVALLAFVFGLLGIACASRTATVFMGLSAFVASVITLVVFVIDMVLWNIVKNHIKNAGYSATLGNANWFTVAALGSLWFATCASCCGAFGRFATGRAAGEKY
ncbi:hypothetical protein BCR39DRAFT_525927 [Naematelia encephala]|uniref:Pali-domain-containing protein n=1 Tax=Naematelia encephala TaxID=71784 RepID=A0A1Y2BAV3_9TREE|nr:hypothetical protein BCR39DRAFT_525927 [Naematelia encephala]